MHNYTNDVIYFGQQMAKGKNKTLAQNLKLLRHNRRCMFVFEWGLRRVGLCFYLSCIIFMSLQ